jgi:glycosyltransferase involved in cell wall biosynthesis
MENKKLISVCIPTFNHGKFIAQTLEGCLMQKTTFDFEIVVGDDGSTDNAPAIIQEYVNRYPYKIRAFLHHQNLGPTTPKELGGKNNVVFLFNKCKAPYIALCEGDDYWTDPLKLQKQVDFLEANPDFALTHHQVQVTYEDGSPSHFFNEDTQPSETSMVELLSDKWYVATCSSVFRNVYQNGMPDWFMHTGSGDLGIFIQAAHQGKIKYFDEVMGIYRKHRAGLSHFQHLQNQHFVQDRFNLYRNVDVYYSFQYHEVLKDSIEKYQRLIV